jgi:hypothetical protein
MSNSRTRKMNKIVAAVLAVATIGAAFAITTTSASAFPGGGYPGHHHGRAWGYGVGGLALGLLGAAAISQSSGYGYGYGRSCFMQRQYDEDGNYMGRTRVCRRVYVD